MRPGKIWFFFEYKYHTKSKEYFEQTCSQDITFSFDATSWGPQSEGLWCSPSARTPLYRTSGGNPLVTGEFPSQRPVKRSFDIFFDLRMNKRSSKQSRRRWFETASRFLWRHCNGIILYWSNAGEAVDVENNARRPGPNGRHWHTFANTFRSVKISWFKFHFSVFNWVQLIISQYWFWNYPLSFKRQTISRIANWRTYASPGFTV